MKLEDRLPVYNKIHARKGDAAYLIIGLLLLAAKVFLLSGLTVSCLGSSPHDDMLFVNYARTILSGEWLGEYNHYTLIKGPTYGLFLAFCNWIHVPYLIVLGIFYGGAVLCFINTMKKIIPSKTILLVMYCYLLFSPVTFDSTEALRIYRFAIIPSAVLLFLSGIISVYLFRLEPIRKLLPRTVITGVTWFFFWYIREDSVWSLPFLAGALVITIGSIFINRKSLENYKARMLIVVALPVVTFLVCTNILCFINWNIYGLYEISDYSSSNYAKAISSIRSIEQDEEIPYVWVNHETVQKLYEVSPTFALIEPHMEAVYGGGWQTWGTGADDGEIEGAYFGWALRDAVASAGYYQDAKMANDYYGKVNEEIEEAFQTGVLQRKKKLSFGVGVQLDNSFSIEHLMEKFFESIRWVIGYEKINVQFTECTGNLANVRLAEAVTGEHLCYPASKKRVYSGWAFASKDQDRLEIRAKVGTQEHVLSLSKSDDVYNHYVGLGEIHENAQNARFSDEFENIEESEMITLQIYINDVLEDSVVLDNGENWHTSSDQYVLHMDKNTFVITDDAVREVYESRFAIPQKLAVIYKNTSGAIFVCSVLGYLILLFCAVRNVFRRQYNMLPVLFICTGLLVSFLAVAMGVSLAYYEAWNSGGRHIYLTACYTLMEMFSVIVLGYIANCLLHRRIDKALSNDSIR